MAGAPWTTQGGLKAGAIVGAVFLIQHIAEGVPAAGSEAFTGWVISGLSGFLTALAIAYAAVKIQNSMVKPRG